MVALRRRWRNSESCTITTDWDVSKLSQALTLRTQAYDVVHKRFGFITEFLSMGADEIEKVAQNLQQCYPNDLELSFPQEFKHFSCFMHAWSPIILERCASTPYKQ